VTTYSTIEAARVAGITVRQANHWAVRGYVRPERVNGSGSGYRLRWSDEDVSKAAMLGALSRVLGQGPDGTGEPLRTFAAKLAVQRGAGVCGVLVDDGRGYEVTIEVRAVGHTGNVVALHGPTGGPRRQP
jgi:hypothetical protein